MAPMNPSQDIVVLQHQGEFLIVEVTSAVEGLDQTSGEVLVDMILNVLRDAPQPMLIIDLTGVQLFGSIFLTVLLRCWKACVTRGGMMVICGAGERVRELLKIVRLDMLWPIYGSRNEAMTVLSSD